MTERSLMFDGIKVIDDEGIITVKLTETLGNNKAVRGWCYDNDTERRTKMQLAREYVEGGATAWITSSAKTPPSTSKGCTCDKKGGQSNDATTHHNQSPARHRQ